MNLFSRKDRLFFYILDDFCQFVLYKSNFATLKIMHKKEYNCRSSIILIPIYICIGILFIGQNIYSQPAPIAAEITKTYHINDSLDFVYSKPKPFSFITNIPTNLYQYSKITFTKKNLVPMAAIAVSTAALVLIDQPLLDGVQHFAQHDLKIAGTNSEKTYLDIKIPLPFSKSKFDVPLNGPHDLNSALYFLGDGVTHFTIAGCFFVDGLITKDLRAKQTASQLTECILSTGFVTQLIKHLTGRESPYVASVPGGKWSLFPNQKTYAEHVPNHDAFPTGHLATAMATVTVIADNYPEYSYIKPVGYGLMGLLAFAMVNNGVHWISDYPLGIALGYGFAKITAAHGKKEVHKHIE